MRAPGRRWAAVVAAVASAASGVMLTATSSGAADDAAACAALVTPALRVIHPTTGASVTSTSTSVVKQALAAGYSDLRGESFRVAGAATGGLVPFRLLTNAGRDQLLLPATAAEYTKAIAQYGYTDSGTAFHASTTALSCTVAISRLVKGSKHRYTADPGEVTALVAAGWTRESPVFHAAPIDRSFSIALLPDTQLETWAAAEGRTNVFQKRAAYLASAKGELDLRYAIQAGDIVNWTRDANGVVDDGATTPKSQLAVAQAGVATLTAAGIPTTLAIGNHDGTAQCGSGSACTQFTGDPRTRFLIRRTSAFNAAFPYTAHLEYGGGAFTDPGITDNLGGRTASGPKIDNSYQRFTAGGYTFLVLSLEIWPRAQVLAWAEQVIRDHAHDNVIVVTHVYLDPDGSRAGGRDTNWYMSQDPAFAATPEEVATTLVARYPAITMVVSGHVQSAGYSVEEFTGNPVINVETDFATDSPATYPTLVSTFTTTAAGSASVTTQVKAPADGLPRNQPWTARTDTVTLVRQY